MKTVRLGKDGPLISEIGIGTWAWGDRLFWNYGSGYGKEDLSEAFKLSVAGGVTFFDSAEVYGAGRSERILGQFTRGNDKLIIASKFFPYPWRLSGRILVRALKKSLARMGRSQIDLYQMHWPSPPLSIESWMQAMADAHEAGLIRHIGVSNYSAEQMEQAHRVLERRGLALSSNQILYSLLERGPEINGLMQLSKDLGVSIIAYSPLGQGLLTGKYSPDKQPRGVRGLRFTKGGIAHALEIVALLKAIGESNGGKSPAQVAINWTIRKGTIPIPGVKNRRQT